MTNLAQTPEAVAFSLFAFISEHERVKKTAGGKDDDRTKETFLSLYKECLTTVKGMTHEDWLERIKGEMEKENTAETA